MSMSKKDYEAIAQAIMNNCGSPHYEEEQNAGIKFAQEGIACSIADYCASQSTTFDRARFLKACGVQS